MCGVQACSRTTPIFRSPITRHNEDPIDVQTRSHPLAGLSRGTRSRKMAPRGVPGGPDSEGIQQGSIPAPFPTGICEIPPTDSCQSESGTRLSEARTTPPITTSLAWELLWTRMPFAMRARPPRRTGGYHPPWVGHLCHVESRGPDRRDIHRPDGTVDTYAQLCS
jgi:hypothetical protein